MGYLVDLPQLSNVIASPIRLSTPAVMLAAALIGLCIILNIRSTFSKYGFPVVGHRSVFEPAWLVRLRFIRGSRSIIKEGYEKHRDGFVVRRCASDIIVIPQQKHIDEIRAQTKDLVRSVEPFLRDLASEYTKGDIFQESDLQNRVLQHKLTPSLNSLVPVMKDELDFALRQEFPEDYATDWVELKSIDVIQAFARIIARIVARVWVGPIECRNGEWIETTSDYTKNVLLTGFILRFVPRIIRPVVAPMLPSYKQLLENIASARRIVGGITEKRSNETETNEDVLKWMTSLATMEELEHENLAQRMLLLSLAGIHTTALTTSQALFELCAEPKHTEIARDELRQVLAGQDSWTKDTLPQLMKMDSLLKESQRLNPVFLLTFNRITPKDITLSNGKFLPKGVRIAVPSDAIATDPELVPGGNPETFDPLRYARMREKSPEDARKHLFAMTDSVHMGFGYGKYSCPGRFFAANEIKMLLGHVLLQFDWKYPEGCGRPVNATVDENLYPDPSASILMRRRKVEDKLQHIVRI